MGLGVVCVVWRKDSSAVFLFFTEASFLKAKARLKNEDSSSHKKRKSFGIDRMDWLLIYCDHTAGGYSAYEQFRNGHYYSMPH